MTGITLEVTNFKSTRDYYVKTSNAIRCEVYVDHNFYLTHRSCTMNLPEGFDIVLSISVGNLKKFLDVL